MNRRALVAAATLAASVLAYVLLGGDGPAVAAPAPATGSAAAASAAAAAAPAAAGSPADAATGAPAADAPRLEVSELAPGFELGRYRLPEPSRLGPGETVFVRLDPARVHLEVRAAALGDKKLRTASSWGATHPDATAVAVMNSSMFQDDWLTSVGRMEVRGEVQNPHWAAQQNSVLVADPGKPGPGTPTAALVDLGCVADRDAAFAPWTTRVQSIRLLGCNGDVVWAEQDRAWSSALIGQDRKGRLLFLQTRAPYSMHSLAQQLHDAPLDLVRMHYTEGGPEASLYVRAPGVERRLFGSYETGFVENDDNAREWELPNVVVAWVP